MATEHPFPDWLASLALEQACRVWVPESRKGISSSKELPIALGEAVPTDCLLCNINERTRLGVISAAAYLQGGMFGREGRMEACFSRLPAAYGKGKAQSLSLFFFR